MQLKLKDFMEMISMKDEELKRLFKQAHEEATWCYSCARRNTCKDKETVAMEEHIANSHVLKHVKITTECIGYIKDGRVKEKPETYFLKKLFG
jgi:hypothetical protein